MIANLFHDIDSIWELEKLFALHPRKPLLPPLGAEAWNRARENPAVMELAGPLRTKALEECGQPLPVLTDELYASFKATGRRIPFESVYFERRRQLGRAVMTLLLAAPGDSQADALTASVLDKFEGVFNEVSWALPAHVNWHNDNLSGKEPMQIDLFCAETANLMAEMLDLFGALIPASLQQQVRERLRTNVWENYARNFENIHWTKATHNWNAVCHQGVLGSALSQAEDPELLARMFWHARNSLSLFIGGFTKDGGCTEGIGYWSYGFGWFAVLNGQLETRTNGGVSLLEGDEHIRDIAKFGPRMALEGGKLVNFSDNSAEGTLNGPLLAYLGKRLSLPDCDRQALASYRALLRKGIDRGAERCDVFYLARLFSHFPGKIGDGGDARAADCLLPNLAVIVAHGRDAAGRIWDFAAKAGHNAEHHNHNDCGSFILNVGGVRFITEIGAPEYTKDFFSPKRYENLAARSLGHSVPLINGVEQAEGETFASSIAGHALGKDIVELVINATKAYPAQAGCRKFVRAFRFEKTGRLEVRDTFELDRSDSLESALIAIYPIILEKDHALIRGGGLELAVRPLGGTRLERVEIHPYSNRHGEEAIIHRLVYAPEVLSASCSVAVEITAAG